MYCKNCGREISDKAYVYPYCGVKTDNPKDYAESEHWYPSSSV